MRPEFGSEEWWSLISLPAVLGMMVVALFGAPWWGVILAGIVTPLALEGLDQMRRDARDARDR
jgi:hypothetical protein